MAGNFAMETPDLGVGKCTLTDFLDALRGQMLLMSGKVQVPELTSKEAIRRPLLVIGKPGIGKTCGIASVIEEVNAQLPPEKHWGFKKILLGQTVVGTLTGIPVVNPTTGEVVRVQVPDLPNPEKDNEYGVLFLDEITTADEAQIQPALGLADDSRSLGEYTLPENWLVVAAGNGPDCSNFVRLDDMTLTRFIAFDVEYSFSRDWRSWAHKKGIDELILAFLNFKESKGESMVRVESTDMDTCGKMFANPRTWTRLSDELKVRAALGNPVGKNELLPFASRIIGAPMATEFAAFAAYRSAVDYDADKIIAGTERMPDKQISFEVFHILRQQLCRRLAKICEETRDAYGNHPLSTYQAVANVIRWIIKLSDTSAMDQTFSAIEEIRVSVPYVSDIVEDPDFYSVCPELETFLSSPAVMAVAMSYSMN